jgi:plastocyanin
MKCEATARIGSRAAKRVFRMPRGVRNAAGRGEVAPWLYDWFGLLRGLKFEMAKKQIKVGDAVIHKTAHYRGVVTQINPNGSMQVKRGDVITTWRKSDVHTIVTKGVTSEKKKRSQKKKSD